MKNKYLLILILSIFMVVLLLAGIMKKTSEKELSYEEAQKLAIKLVNEEFAKKEFREDSLGLVIPKGKIKIDYIAGKKEGKRWVFNMPAIAGPEAVVSFELDGSKPEVRVWYSWD